MIRSVSWLGAYGELQDFVAKYPAEIRISRNVIAIHEKVRPGFYQLFDRVRVAFVEQNFPDLFDNAVHLSEKYNEVEREVVKLLRLDKISLDPDYGRFLHDPKNQMARGLFDPLFDLLKGKIDRETFEKEASGNIEVPLKDLYRLGYQKWVLLSLVKMFEADKSFEVSKPYLETERPMDRPGEPFMPECVSISELALQESKCLLSLEKDEPVSTLIVPDFIVHSALIERYVAVKSENGTAVWTVSEVNEKREWYPLDSKEKYSSIHLRPPLSIYIDDRAEDIALIADSKRACRPDFIVECLEQKDWYEKDGLGIVKLHHDILKPKLGTFMASMEPVPEHILEKLGGEFHLLVVGLNQFKLDSIIDVLKPQAEERMA